MLESSQGLQLKLVGKFSCQTGHVEKISFFEGIHTYFDETSHIPLILLLGKMLNHFLYDVLSQNTFNFDFIFLLYLHVDTTQTTISFSKKAKMFSY